MDSCEQLERATALLRSTICNVPIGVVTLSDFKPTQEKIRDSRERIRALTARIKLLRAINDAKVTPNMPPANPKDLEKKMHQALSSHQLIKYEVFRGTVQSHAVENLLANDEISPELTSKLREVMAKLYSQNDKLIVLQEEIESLQAEERQLQADVAAGVIDFQTFLKEQEQIRNEKLAVSNPEIAKKKQKLNNLIKKINISRRLITNIISAVSTTIIDEPEMFRMLKEHRDIINVETIMEMASNRETSH
ncbi:uncharacterized protein [Fopius arisanus]|uniref:EPS15L1_0 protein n=1 Tax=Fopius arisanus TaxID=64838 RepID=A0A0C9R2M4_9HYME|nr:PREDICTED: uncharacterized protein LOC105266259 [Fopius arisanus]